MHLRRLGRERIEVGDQVAAHAVHVDQRRDLHLLLDERRRVVRRVRVLTPADRLVGHADRAEDLLVEVVAAEQQLVDLLEEQTRLGTLDDAVVVGRRDRDDLGDAEVGDGAGIGAREPGGVVERADADDDALAGHEPRHRPLGADGAGVGERDGDAGEVVDGQLVGLGLADEVVVDGHEAGEVEGVGVRDARHDERARAVALLHVDREAEADVLVAHDPGAAVGSLDEGVVHVRDVIGDGPDDGVADEVREADLAATRAAQVAVDDVAVDLEQLGRHLAERGRRRDAEAGLHVGDDAGADAADRLTRRFALGGRRGGCGRRCGCSRSGRRRRGGRSRGAGRWRRLRGRPARRAVVGEELLASSR